MRQTQQIDVVSPIHGRVLVHAGSGGGLRLLVGFHGYAQNAGDMLAELRGVDAAAEWTTASVQALHRFYRGRSDVTVASWMTREDRGLMIDDNIAYIDRAVSQVADGRLIERLVFCGFSQGVAMAFRAAVRGRHRTDLILALGGDVPPELLDDPAVRFPRVLLARGNRDPLYAQETWDRNVARLRDRGTQVEALLFDGGHEWTDEFRLRAAKLITELTPTDH
jgi:predicted esterase